MTIIYQTKLDHTNIRTTSCQIREMNGIRRPVNQEARVSYLWRLPEQSLSQFPLACSVL